MVGAPVVSFLGSFQGGLGVRLPKMVQLNFVSWNECLSDDVGGGPSGKSS